MARKRRKKTLNCVAQVAKCPKCKSISKKHSVSERLVRTLSTDVLVISSKHYCPECQRHFCNPAVEKHLAPKKSKYGWDLIREAQRLIKEGFTLSAVSEMMQKMYRVCVPVTTLHGWLFCYEERSER